jgi:hypothetical protein
MSSTALLPACDSLLWHIALTSETLQCAYVFSVIYISLWRISHRICYQNGSLGSTLQSSLWVVICFGRSWLWNWNDYLLLHRILILSFPEAVEYGSRPHNLTPTPRSVLKWRYPISEHKTNKQNKLRGFSPPANYTDRATATCRRS